MYINNNLNSVNLIFGPELPTELEAVSLAFVSSPPFTPEISAASLSAERYVKENYDHLNTTLNIFDQGIVNDVLNINLNVPPVSGITNSSNLGGYSFQSNITLSSGSWSFPVVNSKISLVGLNVTSSNNWYPLIKPGVIYRNYTLTAAEPSSSWLRQAIALSPSTSGAGESLILIYSVPEAQYKSFYTGVSSNYPPSTANYSLCKERVKIISPNELAYFGSLDTISQIIVNGIVKFSGQFKEGDTDSYIKTIDKKLKRIILNNKVLPDDVIDVKYYSYQSYYYYSGYRDSNNNWYDFDANPEYSHYINFPDGRQNTSDALANQITIFAIPTACIRVRFTESTDSNSNLLGTLDLQYYRAYDYGETHFIRHMSGSNEDNIAPVLNRSANTWGFATLGSNFYDEIPIANNDTYSSAVPSMMPIGKIMLTAPVSIDNVGISDIRQRGGGVPLDFPFTAVESDSNGLDTLKSMFDLGNWIGQPYKEGGVIEVQIDSSLLKTDPADTSTTTFLYDEIYEIVKRNVSPGISFVIKFVDNL